MTQLKPVGTPLTALPNTSDWPEIRRQGMFFVDKTAQIARLVTSLNRVFISRPRRMGKSTLVSMIGDLFTHGDTNFEGTAIYGHWPKSERFPVINLNFSTVVGDDIDSFTKSLLGELASAYKAAGFAQVEAKVNALLKTIAGEERKLEASDFDLFLKELRAVSAHQRLVFLIDEWDYPLSEHLDDEEIFNQYLKVLSIFYRWLRTLTNLRFVLVTGILRFHETGLFTGQDIKDISMEPKWADLIGVTHQELLDCYAPYISAAAQRLGYPEEQFLEELARHYDGFCFDKQAAVKLYSPYALNNFFMQITDDDQFIPIFENFWMNSSLTTAGLRTILQSRKIDLPSLMELKDHEVMITKEALSKPLYFSQVNAFILMAESGYLTIKGLAPAHKADPGLGSGMSLGMSLGMNPGLTYRCGITNLDVSSQFYDVIWDHISAQLVPDYFNESSHLKDNLAQALIKHDLKALCHTLNTLMCSVGYDAFEVANEAFYRTVFAIWLRQVAHDVNEETHNYKGRSDIVLKTAGGRILVLELKLIDFIDPKEQDEAYFQDWFQASPQWVKLQQKVLTPAQNQIIDHGYGFDSHYQGEPITGVVLAIGKKQRRIVACQYCNEQENQILLLPPVKLTPPATPA